MTTFDQLQEPEPYSVVTWRGMTIFRVCKPMPCECCCGDTCWWLCHPYNEDIAIPLCGPTCYDQIEQLRQWRPAADEGNL